jgi:hypothetical protein
MIGYITLFSNTLSVCSHLNVRDEVTLIHNHRQNYNFVYSNF